MLQAILYHQKVRDYFKAQTKTWEYFSTPSNKELQLQQFKTELLKNTYQFDTTADAYIYDKVNLAKEKLGLQTLPVTVYQSQYSEELNASIVYLNQEAHIVFSGPITKLLDEAELQAVIAHELTHVKLYTMLGGELEIADRIITAIANHRNSEAAHYETARLFRLYTEIFCDRGAYLVTGNIDPVISSLVKASTGLERVSAAAYIKQTDEILNGEKSLKTAGISHPENYIRTAAIRWFANDAATADEQIKGLMEGVVELDQLDIFGQQSLQQLTQNILQLLLKPKWMRSTLLMGLAKNYFPDFTLRDNYLLTADLIQLLEKQHDSIKDYACFILLDFALADAALEEIPMGWAFQLAEDLQLKTFFDAVIKKEMKLSDKRLQQYRQKALSAFSEVKENDSEQIYE
ncbi:MAG: hypothetical protein RLY16_15 [Bacteroidota bacterium]|jgi:hypothetical protein